VEGTAVTLSRLREYVGGAGLAATAVLFGLVLFYLQIVRPLEQHAARLDQELEKRGEALAFDGLVRRSTTPAAQIAAFYRFFEREERIDDWLAKLYATATAAGLEMRFGDYRLADRRYRMHRYQIRLPMTGSYSQIRAFLQAALLEIPVLSIDHASFRRKDATDGRVEAELVVTLHLLSG